MKIKFIIQIIQNQIIFQMIVIQILKILRGYLNLFTLDNNFNNDTIQEILLGEENDIIDLENQLEDVETKSFHENKSKKNNKVKY